MRVVREYGWAHSLEFTADVKAAFDATPPGAPFLIHLGEGTDESAAQEIFRLEQIGALGEPHGIDSRRWIDREAVGSVQARPGPSMIWCPRSNIFTLGRTVDPRSFRSRAAPRVGDGLPHHCRRRPAG